LQFSALLRRHQQRLVQRFSVVAKIFLLEMTRPTGPDDAVVSIAAALWTMHEVLSSVCARFAIGDRTLRAADRF
jgi:hypothetical protein